MKNRGVEQLVARQAHNLEVACSSPASATKKDDCRWQSSFLYCGCGETAAYGEGIDGKGLRRFLPLSYGLEEEDGSTDRNIEGVKSSKHGDTDMGICRLPPNVGESGGLCPHHDSRRLFHVHHII